MSDFASRIAFPRPISAKKKNKFQLFSPVVSCSRLRTVQRLLKCGNNPQAKLSGILCILGIDSRYNGGARRLLNYLLFGFCELTPADVSHSRISDEELEDVVVVVKAESVHVYCNPVNYPLLLPLIAHWRNLHIYCLSHEEYKDDEERAEEFKITSFISMVDGSERIGMPYADGSVGEHQPAFDPFILEKWPLVQAYALEGFGSGGFFTMNHEVFDISQDLQKVYGLLDPVGIETLVTETLPLFERHCKSVLTNVDIESCNDLSEVTERSLSEPIVSYFNHGHISETENGKSSSASCQPFVLLGCNSSRKLLRNPEKLSSRNNNSTLSNSGVDGSQAKHMVCFAVEPRGTIACARTYFLQNGFVPLQLEADKQSHYVTSKDTRLLMDLYLLCVSAVEEGIKTFSQTFSKQQSLSSVRSHLQLRIQEKEIELNPSFLSSNMEFTLDACDCLGRNITLQEDKPHPVIKRVCLYLYDVPSVEHPGKSLGSVVFGESFLDSAVKTLIPDSPSVWSSSVVFLTESIPIFVSWLGSGLEKQASMEMTAFAKSKAGNNLLGKQLLSGNEVFILSSVNKWEEGSLFIYEQGFLFIHPRLGVVLLPMTKLSKLCFYDEGSTSVTALLMLTYQPGLQGNLPSYLANESSSLVLALSPRSRIYRQFYSDVLHLWKGDQLTNMPPFEVTTDLPAHLSRLHLNLQQQLKLSFRGEVYGLSSAEAFLPSLKGFLSHFSVSSSLVDRPVNCEDLPVLLGSSLSEQKQSQDLELLLTILTGVPESGKDGLCLALVALAKENSKWVIIQRPVGQADPFDPKALQKSLSNILTSQRRQHARLSATKRRLRVIIVTPGFTDVIDVTQAITTHPDHEVAKCLKIGAVTCCVDPLNTFMENRLTLPKLLEQCAQGWVNNVVFTSCLEPQNEQLSLTQKLVRASNPDVAFILAKGGEVTRTPDVELILSDSAYDEEKMVQKRHLMCPGWSLGLFSSGSTEPLVNEICVPLYGPLDRLRFVANLKAIQGPISGKGIVKSGAMHSLQGLIYFSEGDIQREVHIRWARLNGALRMTAVDSSAVPRPPSSKGQSNGTTDDIHQYFIVFTGFNLQEQNLKDWLKTCCKPAPVKQKLKVKKDLSDKEIIDITTKHKFDPLPPGWFYNGAHYVSLTGEKDNNHPLLQTFIESYLLRINEDIEQHNIKIDSQQPALDIFEKPRGSS